VSQSKGIRTFRTHTWRTETYAQTGRKLFAVPSRRLQAEAETYLTDHGIPTTTLGADGPRKPDAVHVATLHRFKGLEYQQMLVAGGSAGLIPGARIADHRETDPVRYERELKQARSLLFVAATRARDALTITWHGTPSPFIR
jgi:superfamily I DNA/RNA helicase